MDPDKLLAQIRERIRNMSELLKQLLSLLHEEELIRLRHRAKKKDMWELTALLTSEIKRHEHERKLAMLNREDDKFRKAQEQ